MLAPIASSQRYHQTNRESPRLTSTIDVHLDNTMISSQIKGNNLEQLFLSKDSNLLALKEVISNLTKENDELKKLNMKLVERLEYLQNFIDQEASAHDFYFNYPPKPDDKLVKQAKGIKHNNNDNIHKDAEINKVKQQYEEIIEREKRISESIINESKKSYSAEMEQLYEIISEQGRQLVDIQKKHDSVEAQFKKYYSETDKYMRSVKSNEQQLLDEIDQLKSDLHHYTTLYHQTDQQSKGLDQLKHDHISQIDILSKDLDRCKKKISYYEDKYKFIDIGKLHEQVQFLTSKIQVSEGRRLTLEKELYELRDKIMRATHQMSFKDKKNEDNDQDSTKHKWKGNVDLEETSKAFLLYLQSEIQRSIDNGSSMEEWANRTGNMIDHDNDSYRE